MTKRNLLSGKRERKAGDGAITIQGRAANFAATMKTVPSEWPCWTMDVGDVWVVPEEINGDKALTGGRRVQSIISGYPRTLKKYFGLKFKTKTIDGKLHVWRKS